MEVIYKSKLRRLIVSTLDGTRKTLQVDDSKTIADLMVTICGKMGKTRFSRLCRSLSFMHIQFRIFDMCIL